MESFLCIGSNWNWFFRLICLAAPRIGKWILMLSMDWIAGLWQIPDLKTSNGLRALVSNSRQSFSIPERHTAPQHPPLNGPSSIPKFQVLAPWLHAPFFSFCATGIQRPWLSTDAGSGNRCGSMVVEHTDVQTTDLGNSWKSWSFFRAFSQFLAVRKERLSRVLFCYKFVLLAQQCLMVKVTWIHKFHGS